MSTYTAVVCDARSIGGSTIASEFPAKTGVIGPGATGYYPRVNPQLATARIRNIQNPHIVSEALGGLLSADFLIPAEEALRWKPLLRYGAAVWLFDGHTPIFYGGLEQPVWTQAGDCQVTLAGPWAMLAKSRMREAWELWDMSLLTRGIGVAENKAGQVNLNSDGSLTLSFPNGSVIALNDRVSVDYLLFGETVGTADGKLITAFEFDITDSQNLTAAHRVRVFGKDSPSTGSVQLYDTAANGSSGVQGALNLAGTNQGAAAWPSITGYRCLRFQIQFTAGATTAQDTYATFDRIRISTREALFPSASGFMDTAAIARDLVTSTRGSAGGVNPIAATDIPAEFWRSQAVAGSTDSNTATYPWGFDPVANSISAPNSGVNVTGFTSLEWQSPSEIITALAAIDNSHVGFYLPYNGRGGYDPPGASSIPDAGSFWATAPPQLYYQPFSDPVTTPDYTIHTREGALVEPSADAQPLRNILYTNYQTLHGRQESVVVFDQNTKNYVYAQGFRRADDYTIQPSVGDTTLATSLGQQALTAQRNPYVGATITIENDGATRSPILKQGCTIPRLAQVRPGSVRIVDVAASSGLRAGIATHVEWWGQTATSNERLQLDLTTPPGRPSRARMLGHIVKREHRRRHRLL